VVVFWTDVFLFEATAGRWRTVGVGPAAYGGVVGSGIQVASRSPRHSLWTSRRRAASTVRRKMISNALDRVTASLEEIAEAAGVTYDTLYAWNVGRRNPSSENVLRLADALERRGGELGELAEKPRKEARE